MQSLVGGLMMRDIWAQTVYETMSSKTDGKICWLFQQLMAFLIKILVNLICKESELIPTNRFTFDLSSNVSSHALNPLRGESGPTLFSHWDLIRNRCQNNNSLSCRRQSCTPRRNKHCRRSRYIGCPHERVEWMNASHVADGKNLDSHGGAEE